MQGRVVGGEGTVPPESFVNELPDRMTNRASLRPVDARSKSGRLLVFGTLRLRTGREEIGQLYLEGGREVF